MRTLHCLCLGLALLAPTPPASAGQVLIGVDEITDTLIRIDVTTGTGTPIGPVGDGGVAGLTWDSIHGILYGSSTATDSLLRIDPATGATTIVGPLGFSLVHSVEFNASDTILYGITNQSGTRGLYTLYGTTGEATLVGIHGINGLSGLACDAVTGIMYASDALQRNLYTLDPSTAAPTLIGAFGTVDSRVGVGLAFDPLLGLYASDNFNAPLPQNQLYQINPATGHATLIGNIGYGNVLSLAFVPEEVIPEPAGLPLAGLLAAASLRRRNRK